MELFQPVLYWLAICCKDYPVSLASASGVIYPRQMILQITNHGLPVSSGPIINLPD